VSPAPRPACPSVVGRSLARRSARARLSVLAAALVALLAVLLGGLAGPAAADPVRRPPSTLTAAQERAVLRLVDDRCGDTWCEGDHLFDFRHLSCDRASHSCLLQLRIASLVEPGTVPTWYRRAGRVRGFVGFRDLVATSPTGTRSLTPAFTAALDALVTRLEATVP
jgi:hypothetical protein